MSKKTFTPPAGEDGGMSSVCDEQVLNDTVKALKFVGFRMEFWELAVHSIDEKHLKTFLLLFCHCIRSGGQINKNYEELAELFNVPSATIAAVFKKYRHFFGKDAESFWLTEAQDQFERATKALNDRRRGGKKSGETRRAQAGGNDE